jgi:hypothetical protein
MHFTALCLPAWPPLAAAACRGQYMKDWEKRCRWGLLEIFGKMSVEQASPSEFLCACMQQLASQSCLPSTVRLLPCRNASAGPRRKHPPPSPVHPSLPWLPCLLPCVCPAAA